MSSQVLTDAKILIAGHDLSGQMNAVALEYSAEMKDATTFGQATRINKGGLKSVIGSAAGHWDSNGATAVDPVMFARVGTSNVPVTIIPQGNGQGNVAYLFRAIEATYQVGGEVGELLPFSVEMEGAGGQQLVRGKLMDYNQRTGDFNSTPIQLGAVLSTQYLYAAIHVLSGSGDFTCHVQSAASQAFTGDTTRLTFTEVDDAVAVASEWARVAGAITDTWWRIAITNPGTRNFAVAVGIQ